MRLSRALLAIMVLLVQATFAFGYDKIIIRTGQSSGCGQPDPIFHFWAPQTSCGQPIKPTLFTDADFQSACAGPQAVRVNPYPVWLAGLTHDPAANWIDWHQTSCYGDARSVLYCAQFRVTTDCYPVADSIRVYWVVDDFLGDPIGDGPNQVGVYINGTPLNASFAGGNYATEKTAVAYNVPVSFGPNNLYVYQRDKGCQVAGLIMSCTIYVHQGTALMGYKYNDQDCNGIQGGGELGLPGWQVNISGPVNASTTTPASGFYSFTNIPPGVYTITESAQPGWVQCGPTGGGGKYVVKADSCAARDGLSFGNSECTDTCRTLPSCLTSWYPFDEGSGNTVNDVTANRDLTFQGAGASWLDGCCLWGANLAPPLRWLETSGSFPEHSFGTGSFSLFARIRTNNASDGAIHQILDKRFPNPDLVHPLGYGLFIYQGKVYLQLGDGTGLYKNYPCTTIVSDHVCHLVGAVVCRNSQVVPPLFSVTVIVDNTSTTYNTSSYYVTGNLDNSANLRVGEQSPGFLTGTAFDGMVDDVQLYKCCLNQAQILALNQSGVACHQCGTGAYVPSMASPWFIDPTGAHITMRLCNYSLQTVTLAWTLAGLPGGSCPGANANGPTGFSPASGSVVLGPATSGPTCINIPVRIQIPSGYVMSDVGCYQLTVKNLTNGTCTYVRGKVRPIQIHIIDHPCCPIPVLQGVATPVHFGVKNGSTTQQRFYYKLVGHSADDDTTNQIVSLNGLPPGEPVFGTLDLAPGDSGSVDVNAVLTDLQPLNINEVVLGLSVNGFYDIIVCGAASLESVTPEEASAVPGSPAGGASFDNFAKLSAAPNPFLDRTGIRFSLATAKVGVRVEVFDVAGRLVRNLYSGALAAGAHEYQWDGTSTEGGRSPSGLYFIRVQAPDVLLKTKVIRME